MLSNNSGRWTKENNPLKGKTYVEVYGKEKADEILAKRRDFRHSPETRERLRKKTLELNRTNPVYRARQVAGHRKEWENAKERKRSQAEWARTAMHRPGPLHSNWKGGVSFEPYILGWNKTFKEQIRRRDNYCCRICGVPEIEYGRNLDVHHIDYDKKNLLSDNLISLCKCCHMKTNYDRPYWKEFFNALV